MIRATFQLVSGLGPTRERALWASGVHDWSQLPDVGSRAGLPGTLCDDLRRATTAADVAHRDRDLNGLAQQIPTMLHWRFYADFHQRAVCLDIETDREDGVTTVGLLRADGPHLLFRGRNLDAFPDLVPPDALLITFNGASFDVPVLARTFPDWRVPPAHIDLRHVWARLGHHGGLKSLERALGMQRPDHLQALDGSAAGAMWRHASLGDARALRLLAEYNLYDTIHLRTLAALGYNRSLAQLDLPFAPVAVEHRGDVLYDVSKLLLGLG